MTQLKSTAARRSSPSLLFSLPVAKERVSVLRAGPEPFVQPRQGSQNLLAAQLIQRPGPIIGVAAPVRFTVLVIFSVHGTCPGGVSSSLRPSAD